MGALTAGGAWPRAPWRTWSSSFQANEEMARCKFGLLAKGGKAEGERTRRGMRGGEGEGEAVPILAWCSRAARPGILPWVRVRPCGRGWASLAIAMGGRRGARAACRCRCRCSVAAPRVDKVTGDGACRGSQVARGGGGWRPGGDLSGGEPLFRLFLCFCRGLVGVASWARGLPALNKDNTNPQYL